ncbi:unnamed protein product [Rotaria sp. Silwood2]|nr:unnamed protein product [Rotaria sp. Silwood2]CAF2554053.1 unnamed protein product [Rotaria sp. Silwood2]CAF2961569.1 unnamed protein product [Rotaria sp. Silwood2]CAF3861729.1 unnamed protein product [Rotaria sp. Silwood2]CAF4257207.1 unnamed protein product [Rotaria sp. Silwood2]
MTTSIDPSVDELLLLQENQYRIQNFVLANLKPIGAERKIGQPSNTSTQFISPTKSSLLSSQRMNIDFTSRDIEENNNLFEIPSFNSSIEPSTMSIYDNFHFSSIDEPIIHETNNDLELLTYHPFYNYSSSLASSTNDSSTTHLFDNYNYQRQISSSSIVQQKVNQSTSTQIQTEKTIPSFYVPQTYSTNQFFIPNSCQPYSRNSFINVCQQTRPVFTSPFQCTRERFQVNSIGRPILRANNYTRFSQITGFKFRR